MRLRFTHESDFRQERDFGQKISATVEFIGAHWRGLGRVLLYLVVPATLVQHILSVILQLQMQDGMRGALRNSVQGQTPGIGTALNMQKALWGSMFSSSAYWTNSVMSTAVTTLIILSVYGYLLQLLPRQTPGPEVTVAEVWAVVRREFIGTFFSLWGVFLLMGVGFFMLFIPGLYIGVVLSLFFIAKLTEGTGFGATISRCVNLTSGKWWSTFGLLFIMVLLVYALILGIGLAAALMSGGFVALIHSTQSNSPLFTGVLTTINGLLMLFIYPPSLMLLAFQYFNLVERKDGVGLHHLVNSLGQTAAPQASNAMYRPDEEGEY